MTDGPTEDFTSPSAHCRYAAPAEGVFKDARLAFCVTT